MEEVNSSSNSTNRKWKCLICGIIFEGAEPPEICPVCGANEDQFVEVKEESVSFKKDTDEKFIIIGNGAAGYNAAEAIRKRNSTAKIHIISAEKTISYYRPQLSDYLTTNIPDSEFFISPEDWYKDNNIELILGVLVNIINSQEKNLILSNGIEVKYDKLILANGSFNFIPPVKNNDKTGVFTLKTLQDADTIKEYMKKSKNAVVVGGGLLGLEAASEIKNAGLNVTVVEFENRLLPRQLDEESAVIFKNSISNSGVDILLGDSAVEILGTDKVNAIKLSSGKVIDTDMVLFSVGIRPNISLAQEIGIKISKGIIVNEKMETNIKDIYACGDVAELNSIIYGNWPAAIEMGAIAGRNSVGEEATFKGFISSVIFSALNTEMFSCGDINENLTQISSKDPAKKIFKKLFFKNDKLVGAILLGETKVSGKIMSAIQAENTLQQLLKDNIL